MKKNLFYLFALICSMSLFTACSDDEEDTGWIVYQNPTDFATENATFTVNGVEVDVQERYPLKLTATSATMGKLVIGYTGSDTNVNLDLNYEMDVTLIKDNLGYKISGEKEYKPGYMLNVQGRVEGSKMEVALTSSGYASVSHSYQLKKNLTGTYNSVALVEGLTQPNVDFKATSATAGTVVLGSIVPGMYDAKASGSSIAVPVTFTNEKEVYNFTGELKGDDMYTASVITVKGKIAESKMEIEITHKINSPLVGEWKVKMANPQQAEVIFDFHTASNKTTFSENIMALVANDPQFSQIIKKEMTDVELSTIVGGLLSTYVPNLNAIELKETGDVVLKFTVLGSTEPTEIAGMLNYVIKDGKLSLVPNMGALMGMMSGTKAYDPSGLLMGDGIPFDFEVKDNNLSLSIQKDVPMGLLPLVQMIVIPMLPQMGIIDEATVEMINVILSEVTTILAEETTTLKIGLVMTK